MENQQWKGDADKSEIPSSKLVQMDNGKNNTTKESENTHLRSKRDSALSTSDAHPAHPTKNDVHKSKTEKVKDLGRQAKSRTKHLLWKHQVSPEEIQAEEDDYDDPYEEIHNPAFEPSQLVGDKSRTPEAVAQKTASNLKTGVRAIIHPLNSAKRKAASKVAVDDKPYLSTEADADLLNAHDNLNRATSCSNDGRNPTSDDEVEQEKDRIHDIEELRKTRKVAWTTSHQIGRVLVVPKREVPPPKKEDFYVYDEASGKRRFDWKSWLSEYNKHVLLNFATNCMGHVDYAGQPPFDSDLMVQQLERLLIASSPWQSWFSSLRQLYRWENPTKTRRWFLVWFLVWYLDYIVSFALAYMAYVVLENRFRSKNVAALRESYDRIRDRGQAAYKFNELITKHGNDKWLDPAMEQIGPVLQNQITDLASFLETINNFYDWRVPDKTWATLFWFLCAILLGVLTSTQHSMKIVWMFCILQFFLGFWVSSHYPEYRHVVNALLWIFWDIPNDGEWSMMYLREKAQETRARIIEKQVQKRNDDEAGDSAMPAFVGSLDIPPNSRTEPIEDAGSDVDESSDSDADSYATAESSTSILGGLDILSFRCHHRGLRGRLMIFSDGLRFERLGKEVWRHMWNELVEIRKIDANIAPGLPKSKGLEMIFTKGSDVRLEGVKTRDRAFNCIIGFSGLQFQVLPPVATVDCENQAKEMRAAMMDAGEAAKE